ncbi:MAG: LysR family transcriptional regulator, partial [Myxococcota bacterium]
MPVQKSPIDLSDWDALRVMLAVARAGSFAGAARALDVEHSTVLRRVRSAERQVGAALFARVPTGCVPTPAGEALLEVATAMDHELNAAIRRVQGAETAPEGPVRLAASELLAHFVLPRLGPALVRELPGLVVDTSVSSTLVDLDRREADLAIRAQEAPPDHLVGRRIGRITYGAYVARATTEAGPVDLGALPWIGFSDAIAHYPNARWMHRTWPNARVVARCDSTLAIQELVAAGVGAGVLP